MKKNKISKNWIHRQKNDIYVRQSKIEGFRSRAVYKIKEIDEKFKIFNGNSCIIDLGAAPGSWSQYIKKKYKQKKLQTIFLSEPEKTKQATQTISYFSILAYK